MNAVRLLAGLALMSAVVVSHAQEASTAPAETDVSKWYVGAGFGVNQLSDTDNTATTQAGPASPGPICGLLNPLLPLPQELCNLLGGAPGTPAAQTSVTTSFDPGLALSATIGYRWDDHWRPEVSFSYLSSDVKSISAASGAVEGATGKTTAMAIMANAWYDFSDAGSKWRPYAGIGVGVNNISAKGIGVAGGTFADGSSTVFAYQAGAGISYRYSDRLTLSADYRYLTGSDAEFDNPNGNATESGYDNHAVYAGLRYFLSNWSDDAGKGNDTGANQPKPCSINPAGLPAEALGPDGCPLDADGDGIPDINDECPSTPAGAQVLPNGCALKGDCRKPRPGEEVDAKGCAIDDNFILRGVKFEFDSDRLLPQSKEILNQVAETLKTYPDVKVQVGGHTDNIGSDAYNLGLSERRATVVKEYLGGRGADAANLTPVGYGEARPIADNNTDAGREENRRVEFTVEK